MLKTLVKIAVGAAIAVVLGAFVFGALVMFGVLHIVPAEKQTATEPIWLDETGYAVKDDESTPRFSNEWLPEYLRKEGFEVSDNTTWYQARKGKLIVSWGEWGEGTHLGAVEGVTAGKALFIQTRDKQAWVDESSVKHIRCGGSFVNYNETEMRDWDVSNSTILQVEGPENEINDLVEKMSKAWVSVRVVYEGCVP